MSKKNKEWSSESHKTNPQLADAMSNVSEEEVEKIRKSIDPDVMGFDGAEYLGDEEANDA